MRVIIVAALSMTCPLATAGPPYVTDDPVPTDYQHWEIYQFVDATKISGLTNGAVGLDLNYGGAENLQLTLVLPAEFEHQHETHWISGTMELAAKYRILHLASDHVPDIALFPRVFIPTHRTPEPQHLKLLLPVWLGKERDEWSWFAGGGYLINPGVGNRNAWLGGIAVTRSLSERLNVGIEMHHQTAQTSSELTSTGVNFGVDYKLSTHWSLLGSLGRGIQHVQQEGESEMYLAVKADY